MVTVSLCGFARDAISVRDVHINNYGCVQLRQRAVTPASVRLDPRCR